MLVAARPKNFREMKKNLLLYGNTHVRLNVWEKFMRCSHEDMVYGSNGTKTKIASTGLRRSLGERNGNSLRVTQRNQDFGNPFGCRLGLGLTMENYCGNTGLSIVDDFDFLH